MHFIFSFTAIIFVLFLLLTFLSLQGYHHRALPRQNSDRKIPCRTCKFYPSDFCIQDVIDSESRETTVYQVANKILVTYIRDMVQENGVMVRVTGTCLRILQENGGIIITCAIYYRPLWDAPSVIALRRRAIAAERVQMEQFFREYEQDEHVADAMDL